MNLLVLDSHNDPAAYELKRIFNELIKETTFRYKWVDCKKASAEMLNWADKLMFIRAVSQLEYMLARICQKRGKEIIYAADDDLLAFTRDYGWNRVRKWGRSKYLRQTIELSAILISGSDILLERYRKIGGEKQCLKTDTAFTKEQFACPAKPSDRLRLVLYVSDGSVNQFEEILHPALRMLQERLPDRIDLDLMTLHPDCRDLHGINVKFIPHIDYEAFKKHMRASSYDIGVAPLIDGDFVRGKYFNKYVEYSLGGVFGIYSDIEVYRKIVIDGENGALVANDPEAWADAIEYWFYHPKERSICVHNAQHICMEQFGMEKIVNRFLQFAPLWKTQQTGNVTGIQISIARLYCRISSICDRLAEAIYLLVNIFRVEGMAVGVKKLWKRLSGKYGIN